MISGLVPNSEFTFLEGVRSLNSRVINNGSTTASPPGEWGKTPARW